jgi:hypothetical protein
MNAETARALRNAFYREADAPMTIVVPVTRKGKPVKGKWTTESSDSRVQARGLALQLRALYLANTNDAHVCQCWAQVEMYAGIKRISLSAVNG